MGRALAWVGGGLLGYVRPRPDRDVGAAAGAGGAPQSVTDPAKHHGRDHDTPW